MRFGPKKRFFLQIWRLFSTIPLILKTLTPYITHFNRTVHWRFFPIFLSSIWRIFISFWYCYSFLRYIINSICQVVAARILKILKGCPNLLTQSPPASAVQCFYPCLKWLHYAQFPTSGLAPAIEDKKAPAMMAAWLALYHSLSSVGFTSCKCSGQEKPDSWGHRSKALNNLGSGNLEWGGLRKGRSV